MNYELIARVLSERGPLELCEDDVRPHCETIGQRYRELKRTHDFCTAAINARAEWLRAYMEGQTNEQAPASPWPMPIHNPDNLPPEQFGDPAIWRPATPDELRDVEGEVWVDGYWVATTQTLPSKFNEWAQSYRIRRDVRDWPTPITTKTKS